MSEGNRGPLARVGVSLLNLLAPGLGLLRIGRWRCATTLYGISIGAAMVFVAGLSTTQMISFTAYAALAIPLLVITLVVYALAIWFTWRGSGMIIQPRPVWSRWYAIVVAMLAAFGVSWVVSDISRSLYRNFYIPSEAMEPTLYKNDRFVASMHHPSKLNRGDLILVKAPGDTIYTKRLAALPGDTIELRNGVVLINGVASELRPEGTKRVSYPYVQASEAQLFSERFPGEENIHHIQDLGPSAEDDMSEVLIPPGHIFVLGDNRDNSADSRVSKIMGGLELVPVEDVVGRPLFLHWPLEKMGRSLREDH